MAHGNKAVKYPQSHFKSFECVLQADGYKGYGALYEARVPKGAARVIESGCWSHCRRGFMDLCKAMQSPVAAEALTRIGQLYRIEREIRRRSAEERRIKRQARPGPILEALHGWFLEMLGKTSRKGALGLALQYPLNRWEVLCRYRDDGRLESITSLPSERCVDPVLVART